MAINEEVLLDFKVQDQQALDNIEKLSAANDKLKSIILNVNEALKTGQINEKEAASTKAVLNAQIKENNAGIRENSKEIKTNTAQVASATDSVNGMRARIADLNGAWNSLSASARESDVGKAIQSEMKTLNEGVNAASLSVGNFKDNIGNYPNEMKAFNASNTSAGKAMETLGISADMSMKQMAKSVASGVSSVAKSFTALLLNPVVLFFAAIVSAVMLLVKAFNRSEESSQKLNKVMGALGAVFNGLLKVLEPVANFLVDKLLKAFDTAANSVEKFVGIVSKGLKFVGLDKAAATLDNLTKSVKNSAKAGKELADAEFALQKAQRESRKIQLEYQDKAEKLRQIRQDESKSIKERTAANIELGKVLKKQSEEELAIANEAVRVQKMRIAINGSSTAALDELAAKETEVADIKERITGQESEQLENMNSLRKEASEKRIALLEYEAKKALEIAKNSVDNSIKELQFQLKLEKLKRDEANAGLIQNEKEKLEIQNNAAIELQNSKLKEFELLNKIEIDNQNVLTKEREGLLKERQTQEVKLKIEELDKQIQISKDAQNEISNNEILANQEAKTIIAQNNAAFDESEKQRKKQKQQDDLDNELAALYENSSRAFEIKKEQLDLQMAAEIEAANKTGAEVSLIQEKYKKQKQKLDKEEFQFKLSVASQTANSLSKIFGETTKAGKVAASAAVVIDSISGSIKAFNSMAAIPVVGTALGAIAAAGVIATGVKAVKDIWAVSETSGSSTVQSSNASGASGSSATATTYTNLPTLSGMYSSTANQTETAQIIQSSQPSPVVSVTDITLMQKSVAVKEKSKL